MGNLDPTGAARVAIIAMDHAQRLRLKILGTARMVDVAADPELCTQLAEPGYAATIERAVLLTVDAYDWNCPQHITPRFTATEIQETFGPLLEELQTLRAENARLRAGRR